MATFWDATDREAICRRVDRLTPHATARWGKFTPASMLAHLNDAMRMASGELPVKSKNGPLRYWPLKQLIIYVFPFPKGAPTAPELLARCQGADLQSEKADFAGLVARVTAKRPGDPWPEHPAFGVLTYKDWGVLAYKHADHHLRQFGL